MPLTKQERADVLDANIAKWGEVGSPIPGSRMYRWYCTECLRPIRVLTPDDSNNAGICCEVCSGTKKRLTPGGIAGPVDEDSDGNYGNKQRAMEGI